MLLNPNQSINLGSPCMLLLCSLQLATVALLVVLWHLRSRRRQRRMVQSCGLFRLQWRSFSMSMSTAVGHWTWTCRHMRQPSLSCSISRRRVVVGVEPFTYTRVWRKSCQSSCDEISTFTVDDPHAEWKAEFLFSTQFTLTRNTCCKRIFWLNCLHECEYMRMVPLPLLPLECLISAS